jgi:hypothetical protein
MRQDRYTTKKFSFVCLNLEPQHYEFLKEIANTRFDGSSYRTIFYLLNKYLHHLYEIRITPSKLTETATYQPRTKQYKRRTIKMNPVLWSKLFETRHFVGYSISAMIRIMLDWEMQSQGYDIIPLVALPQLPRNESNVFDPASQEYWTNNYFYQKQGVYETREIICSFFDQFF